MHTKGEPVQIKGQKQGLRILLDDQIPAPELFDALDQKLFASRNFFAGAEVTITIGAREFSPDETLHLHDLIEQKYALHIKQIETAAVEEEHSNQRVLGNDDGSKLRGRRAGRSQTSEEAREDDDFIKALDETFQSPSRYKRRHREPSAPEQVSAQEDKTIYYRGTVRSGQSLEFPGNIVILGDVNPGSYVVASGDIIVMGRLNGVVHAGAEGEERAVIIAAGFSPSQLRIAHYIGRPPDEYAQSPSNRARTEKASVKDGVIVIEPIL